MSTKKNVNMNIKLVRENKHGNSHIHKRNSRSSRTLFYLFSVMMVCFLTMLLVLSHSLKTNANERRAASDRIYSSICIQDGDTLWKIANEYKPEDVSTKEYIRSLKKINQISSDTITSGHYLIVYDYAD